MTDSTLQQKLEAMKLASAQGATDKVAETLADVAKAPVKQQVAALQAEKEYHVFYSTFASGRMLTKTGRIIPFVNNRHITDTLEVIEYLQAEIALGHPALSVKVGQEVMTTSELDPMAALKKKHFAEFAAAQREVARKITAGEPLSQSESEIQVLTPGSTADIADLAGDSSSLGGNAAE